LNYHDHFQAFIHCEFGPTVFAGTGLETSFGDLYGFSATVRHMSIKTDKFCTLLG